MRGVATLRVGRRFMRSRSLATSTWLMAAVSATVVALFIGMSALTLSGDQIVEREMGRFAFRSYLGNTLTLTPKNASIAAEIEATALAGGATAPMVTVTSVDVEPAQVDPPTTWFTEADWERSPFPNRYVLLRGRWPEQPGEVVVAHTSNGSLAELCEELAVLAGHERFTVVGIVDDRYGDYHAILAAPGTFASIGEAALRNFPSISAMLTLFWEGSQRQSVIDAVSDFLSRELGQPRDDVALAVAATTQDRSDVSRTRRTPWIERIPASYGIPALLLPFLASLATFGLSQRRLHRSGTLLVALGLPPGRAAKAIGIAVTGWLMASLAAGVAVGAVIGLIARGVLSRFHLWAQPLSPFPSLLDPILRLGISAAAACLVGTVWIRFAVVNRQPSSVPEAPTARPSASRARRYGEHARHGAATLAACAAILQTPHVDTAADPMVLAGTIAVGVLLLVPEVVDQAMRLLPNTGPRLRLARQQLVHNRSRTTIAVAALAAVLGLPLGYVILFDAMIKTGQEGLAPDVAPHQVLVSETGGKFQAPTPEVLAVVREQLGVSRPTVQIRYLWGEHGPVAVDGSGLGAVLALDTLDDVSRLIGRPLTETEQTVLVDGGMLAWDDREGRERVLVTPTAVGAEEVRLPAVAASLHPAWRMSTNGVLLTATAERLGLPIMDGGIVFTDVSDADARAARRAVLDAGLDPRQVVLYETVNPFVPRAYFTAAAGLMLVVLLCAVAVARAQVLTLRRYLGTLIAIGLTPTWAQQVVLAQNTFFVAVSTVVALALAIPPVVVTAMVMPNFVLSIPWRVIGVVIAAFYLAVLLATVLSCRQIRASDRVAL